MMKSMRFSVDLMDFKMSICGCHIGFRSIWKHIHDNMICFEIYFNIVLNAHITKLF
jgi:hypothetical protein